MHSTSTPTSSKISLHLLEMNFTRRSHLCYFIALSYFCMLFAARATLLPDSEVEALKEIWQRLGKRDWDFDVDPCSDKHKWNKTDGFNDVINNVSCNCTATVCHVVSIVLKAQSLPGVLPPELVKLPYLQAIDLTRNYLNGSIPKEWGSMQLLNISLVGNRISGLVPVELGNITTLKLLELDFNQLSGALPHELGNMTSIEKLTLTSNNFTGPLPNSIAKLTNLKDFRISSNNFGGTVPNFLQDLINLEKLVIQASGLQGPIPDISMLTKLTDLRIAYLNGSNIAFPPLQNMKTLKTLILRSCNINGEIPSYIGDLAKLKTLDLSFNNLRGVVPIGLKKVKFFYLTGNAFTGPAPEWMLNSGRRIDLSFNNFTQGAPDSRCQQRSVNFFGSPLVKNNSERAGIAPCLKSFKCRRKPYYSFHINCGGDEVITDGRTVYEDDKDPAGASWFYQSRSNWAFSSTGDFMDNDNEDDIYIVSNVSRLLMKNYKLYTYARVAPVSLTYYGFCLLNNRNYSVSLHFAEIMLTNDRTYASLGRRIFDIYIQGKLVHKDFNIKDAAGGVGKNVTKKYTALVEDGTLEIRFHWAGKGTEGIPTRGTYGPLVSAISVDPDFIPPPDDGNKISPGIVVVIALSIVVFIIIIVGILWWKGCFRRKNEIDKDLRGLDLQTGTFTLRQLKAATNNFAPENKIGEGGFGSVYKGNLLDGTIIAVKQLSARSKQGNREFVNEIGMISALQHPNLVKLYGCCIEGNQLLLVYEYMENNSLARALFGHEEYHLMLDWPTRQKICVGLAKALAYLHEESRLKIVHRDIKATNVLLDKDLNAKLSDFGLAKLDEEDTSHISTRIAGTFGYMAPEYAMKGYLTDKADVYSFGVVALEIVSGRSNTNYKAKEGCVYLLEWALMLHESGDLMELVDPALESNYNKEELLVMIDVALQCTNATPTLRPIMSSVVSMLEGRTGTLRFVSNSSISGKDTETKNFKDQYHFSPSTDQTRSMLSDGPWTETSASSSDLYPSKPDSQYWQSREHTSF